QLLGRVELALDPGGLDPDVELDLHGVDVLDLEIGRETAASCEQDEQRQGQDGQQPPAPSGGEHEVPCRWIGWHVYGAADGQCSRRAGRSAQLTGGAPLPPWGEVPIRSGELSPAPSEPGGIGQPNTGRAGGAWAGPRPPRRSGAGGAPPTARSVGAPRPDPAGGPPARAGRRARPPRRAPASAAHRGSPGPPPPGSGVRRATSTHGPRPPS